MSMNEAEMAAGAVAASGGTSSAKAAGAYGMAKGAAMASGAGGVFIALLTMAMATPKSPREVFLALASMLFFAVCGSAIVILCFNLPLPPTLDGHLARSGIAAICGAPGWLIVRAWFKWSETKGIDSLSAALSALLKRMTGDK